MGTDGMLATIYTEANFCCGKKKKKIKPNLSISRYIRRIDIYLWPPVVGACISFTRYLDTRKKL